MDEKMDESNICKVNKIIKVTITISTSFIQNRISNGYGFRNITKMKRIKKIENAKQKQI